MQAYPIACEISGPTAMWTRPDTGDAPVSYPAPTFAAVKGIFESIVWLKSAEVVPTRVEICAPLIWHSYTTNYRGPLRESSDVTGGTSFQLLATVLVNVRYRLYADAVNDPNEHGWYDRVGAKLGRPRNGAHAYKDMFVRRLKNGQWHSVPCLGWKEFVPDYVGPFRQVTRAGEKIRVQEDINETIPSMLRQVFVGGKRGKYGPVFDQDVEINNGVLDYRQERKEAGRCLMS